MLSESGMPDPTADAYTAGTELGLSNLGSRIVGSLGALRGIEPALAGEARGRMGLSRDARGGWVVRFLGSLRFDRAAVGWRLGRSAGSSLRSLGVSLGDDFALHARGLGVRLLSSLRLDRAAVG